MIKKIKEFFGKVPDFLSNVRYEKSAYDCILSDIQELKSDIKYHEEVIEEDVAKLEIIQTELVLLKEKGSLSSIKKELEEIVDEIK